MEPDIAAQLLRINREFYQTFGLAFSETRQRIQPGMRRLMPRLLQASNLLDLGCGNGSLARALAGGGHHGRYVGVDSSEPLLAEAREDCPHPSASFLFADLAEPGWEHGLPLPFDWMTAFAVLHHLPGEQRRAKTMRRVRGLLAPDGRVALSVWNFLTSDRLRERILPWEHAGLSAEAVEEGDYLLDWRRGGRGMRYVHHFTPETLTRLAEAAGFAVEETFFSDGEGGRLGLYQVWVPAIPHRVS